MNRLLVGWSYAVEIMASAIGVIGLCLWLSKAVLLAFLRTAAIDIATLFGAVMLAAALAFLWTFFSKVDTPFYRWLDSRGAFNVYLRATGYSVLVSFLSTASLVIFKHVENDLLGLAAAFLLLLAILNMYTLVMNIIGLMRLSALFASR
jgi:hypothetical protein